MKTGRMDCSTSMSMGASASVVKLKGTGRIESLVTARGSW